MHKKENEKGLTFPVLALPLEQWLLSQLRGMPRPFPARVSAANLKQLARFTADTGIQPFLYYVLSRNGGLSTCPAQFKDELHSRFLMERVTARVRKEELSRILTAFDCQQVEALVLKGTALAHQIYPETNLRPACDIDLLVPAAAKERAEQALLALGYEHVTTYSFESQFLRREGQFEHLLDLHWKLSDSVFLSPLFEFEELQAEALPLNDFTVAAQGLGQGLGLGLGTIDALINVCLHLAHHRDFDHLVWLLDVDLLCQRLTDADFEKFLERVIAKQCGAIVYLALLRTREVFGTPRLHTDFTRLNGNPRETSSYLLEGERDMYREFWQLLRVSTWRARCGFFWQALFPPFHLINPVYHKAGVSSLNRLRARRLRKMPFRYLAIYRRKLFGQEE